MSKSFLKLYIPIHLNLHKLRSSYEKRDKFARVVICLNTKKKEIEEMKIVENLDKMTD